MVLKVFSVRDQKAEAFMSPFCTTTAGVAVRHFTSMCQDKGSQIGQFPEDFALFMLGEYDDSKGSFINGTPAMLATGKEVLNHG